MVDMLFSPRTAQYGRAAALARVGLDVTVPSMTNQREIEALHAELKNARTVLLTGPKDPDGDSIGACLALACATNTFSDADVHVAGETNYRYDWMPGADSMRTDAELRDSYDLVVVMDGDRTRLTPAVTALFADAAKTALVDHHGSSSREGYDVVVLEPDSPSTCEMVSRMLESWGVRFDTDIATHLYTGIIFDTGGFRHENTQPATHRLAAQLIELGVKPSPVHAKVLNERTAAGLRLLGQVLSTASFYADGAVVIGHVSMSDSSRLGIASGDMEGVVDALLNTAGVEVACLVTERAKEQVKLSLRSRSWVNVAKVAKGLDPGGGGHVRASGVTLSDTLSGVLERLPAVLSTAATAT